MASKGQMTGMRGVYLVAAEMSKLGFIVSPTSRSAAGADLLVTDQRCKKAFSVQVKADATSSNFWLIGKKAKTTVSSSHIYVLVKIRTTVKSGESIEYFVVPSGDLSKLGFHDGAWPNIQKTIILKYKDKWSVFGSPEE